MIEQPPSHNINISADSVYCACFKTPWTFQCSHETIQQFVLSLTEIGVWFPQYFKTELNKITIKNVLLKLYVLEFFLKNNVFVFCKYF